MSAERRTRKPRLEGRSVWPLDEVCSKRGIEMDQLKALVELGHLAEAVLFDEDGRPVFLFEDSVPDQETFAQLLDLLQDPPG